MSQNTLMNIQKAANHLLLLLAAMISASCAKDDGLGYVAPLIGTEGEGSQYGGMMPMAGVPFGSIQWVPMTRLTEVSRLSFNSSDSLLLGFIGTRQPAIWMGDWGQVSIQPQTTPKPETNYAIRGQRITSSIFTPFDGLMIAGGIKTYYSGLEHSAIFEFSDARHMVIDVSRIASHNASDPSPHLGHIEFSKDGKSVRGWNSDRFDGGHTSPKPDFKGYFHMEFSRPFSRNDVPSNDHDEVQASVSFEKGGPLTVRIGVSLISYDQARKNMHMEIGSRTARAVARIAKSKWQKKFDVLKIDAPENVKTIFYTGFYHSLLYPRQTDEYGRYFSAFDDSVHEGVRYDSWSMWDTYRAEHPLLTLIAPERVDGMMQSLIEMYHEGGWLPKWPNPSYTGIMIGSPAETILAEAWTKGFRGFDLQEAYKAVRKNATVPQPTDTVFDWRDRGNFGDTPETRGGLTRYMTLGYVAGDETKESVSRTQDFGLQDLAAAILADAAGFPEDADYFRKRSRNYMNLWNPDSMLFLPKSKKGEWMEPLNGRHYCECSPQTAVWCIPYDIEGLADLMGGEEVLEQRLDNYFDSLFWKPERGNKSIHGNEPSHHAAYIYNRIGRPEKTQERVREILTKSYSSGKTGFDGNEDCGQMSAWYILSSLGLYMLNPANGTYEIGSPIIREATLKIGWPYNKARLHIKVENYAPDHFAVRKATFNGRELTNWQISHAELIRGGELVFTMR